MTPVLAVDDRETAVTFRDETLERCYRDDGFVTMPFLDRGEIDEITSIYWSLAPDGDSGLTVDYLRPDRHYMAAISEMLAPVWARHFPLVFTGHRAIFVTFVVKHPGPTSDMFLHEDRSWVDERRLRSGTLWIPMVDIGPDLSNGGLQIVRHSHRLATTWSGTGTPDLIRPYERELRGALEPLTMAAGTAVYYDSRTLHASPANFSDAPRVALACGVAPADAQLIHVVAAGPRHRRIYAVDEEFFIRYGPREIIDGMPPQYPVIEEHDEDPVLTAHQVRAVVGDAALRESAEPIETPEMVATGPRLPHALPTPTKLLAEYELRLAGSRRSRWLAPLMARLVGLNNRLIRRADAGRANPTPSSDLAWMPQLADDCVAIGAEWDRFAAAGGQLPLLDDIFGGSQGNTGSWWRGAPVVLRGKPLDAVGDAFPVTVAALARVPGLHSAMWSVMGPSGHLPDHEGPNCGGLRLLVGIRCGGDAVIRVGGDEIALRDGEAVLFDDTELHGSINRGDVPRVLLLCDVVRPLPMPYRWFNRLVQDLHHELIPRFRAAPAISAEWFRALNPDQPLSP